MKNINTCIFGKRSQRAIIDFLCRMKYTAKAIGESDYCRSVPHEIHSTGNRGSDYCFSVPYEIHSTASMKC